MAEMYSAEKDRNSLAKLYGEVDEARERENKRILKPTREQLVRRNNSRLKVVRHSVGKNIDRLDFNYLGPWA